MANRFSGVTTQIFMKCLHETLVYLGNLCQYIFNLVIAKVFTQENTYGSAAVPFKVKKVLQNEYSKKLKLCFALNTYFELIYVYFDIYTEPQKKRYIVYI